MVKATPVPVADVPRVWPVVREWVAEAIQEGDGWWTEAELLRRLSLGQIAMWVIEDDAHCGVVICEIEHWDTKTVCNFPVVAGRDFAKWKHLIAVMEEWARKWGATEMHIRARPGFQRLMRNDGFQLRSIMMAKDI